MKFLNNLTKNATKAAMGVAGGAVGRVITNKVMPMIPVVKDYEKFHEAGTFLLALAAMDMKGMQDAGFGMASVAGTDFVAQYVTAIQPKGGSIQDDASLAEDLADELESRLADDVANANASMNDDVTDPQASMNDDVSEEVSGSEDE